MFETLDFDDVDDFVLGITNPAQYEATYGVPGSLHGDFDGDGDLDFDDIPGFVEKLSGGGAAAQSGGSGGTELATEYSTSQEFAAKLDEVAGLAAEGLSQSERLIWAAILMQLK